MNSTPSRPLATTGGLLRRLATLALLAALMMLAGCKSMIDLQSGLNDAEANEVIAALREDGIIAHKKIGKEGASVQVPEADLPRASDLLKARGLPRRRQARLGEIFKKEGLISSPMEEKARFIYALSQEIEFTLGQIDGVVLARVHVVLPEKAAPGEPLMPSSAAVFIKHRDTLDPDVIQQRVRRLVARSIPGLGEQGIDKVTTVFVPASKDPPKVVETVSGTTIGMWAGLAVVLLGGLAGVGWWQRARLLVLIGRKPAVAAKPAAA